MPEFLDTAADLFMWEPHISSGLMDCSGAGVSNNTIFGLNNSISGPGEDLQQAQDPETALAEALQAGDDDDDDDHVDNHDEALHTGSGRPGLWPGQEEELHHEVHEELLREARQEAEVSGAS